MVLAVFGSRAWSDKQLLFAALSQMFAEGQVCKLIAGGDRNVDMWGILWAQAHGIATLRYPPRRYDPMAWQECTQRLIADADAFLVFHPQADQHTRLFLEQFPDDKPCWLVTEDGGIQSCQIQVVPPSSL